MISDSTGRELFEYDRKKNVSTKLDVSKGLIEPISIAAEQKWIESAQALALKGDMATTRAILEAGINEHPNSVDLRFALAGILQQTGRFDDSESLLREILIQQPNHTGASFLLANMLSDRGRLQAMALVFRSLFSLAPHDVELTIQAVEALDECGKQADAAAICEAQIEAGVDDARLHAYAGMLQIQLGQFAVARKHYLYAIAHDDKAVEWNIPTGLSALQRYTTIEHPDISFFLSGLERSDLSDNARASLGFALAKAHDDVGNYAEATRYLREANASVHRTRPWSRKHWRRMVEARLSATPRPARTNYPEDWTPVFIIGAPRSGTTLAAELLSRFPGVKNRGELACLPRLAKKASLLNPDKPELLEDAAAVYEAQSRQDDSSAHWFIDKQPLNILRVDLILAMWPNARIIYCERGVRDTAVSLWFQHFVNAEQDYAYDFADIAVVINDCRRLAVAAIRHHAGSIYKLRYEELISNPAQCIGAVVTWLGIATEDLSAHPDSGESSAISTGSLWQARQPVYKRSVGRWLNYSPYVPELLKLPAD